MLEMIYGRRKISDFCMQLAVYYSADNKICSVIKRLLERILATFGANNRLLNREILPGVIKFYLMHKYFSMFNLRF